MKRESGGVKNDQEKLRWDLLPYDAIRGIVSILTYGAKKYDTIGVCELHLSCKPNVTSIGLFTVNNSAEIVTKGISGKSIPNLRRVNSKTELNGAEEILIKYERRSRGGSETRIVEKGIGRQKDEDTSPDLELQPNSMTPIEKGDVFSVAVKNSYILTMTIKRGNTEESYVASATTASGSLTIVLENLKRLGLISKSVVHDDFFITGERNWEDGMDWHRPYAALQRHLTAWWEDKENCDPETGKSHLWHAGCCLLFLIAYEIRGLGKDDRPTHRPR